MRAWPVALLAVVLIAAQARAEDDDYDGDGWTEDDGDCDDHDPLSWPGAPELCDGLDNDCSGGLPDDELDDDYDGWMPCDGDCDDRDFRVHADMRELCEDGVDNDCDGEIDELCFDDSGDELPQDVYGCAFRLGGGQAALMPLFTLLPWLRLRRR